MGSTTYYVAMAFRRNEEGELIALDPIEAPTPAAAVSRARSLAAKEAGAIAFSRTGDPELGEFQDAVVLVALGDVPTDISVV
ncbi:MAG: hypothetical protein AB7O43_07130 [Hyphomicrobiaceae bacterium]